MKYDEIWWNPFKILWKSSSKSLSLCKDLACASALGLAFASFNTFKGPGLEQAASRVCESPQETHIEHRRDISSDFDVISMWFQVIPMWFRCVFCLFSILRCKVFLYLKRHLLILACGDGARTRTAAALGGWPQEALHGQAERLRLRPCKRCNTKTCKKEST